MTPQRQTPSAPPTIAWLTPASRPGVELANRPGVVFVDDELWRDWSTTMTRDERVGVLAGRRSGELVWVEAIHEFFHTDRSQVHARIDGAQWARIVHRIEDSGLANVGLIHTHPGMEPVASAHDLETQRLLASGMVHIIVSPQRSHALYWGPRAQTGGELQIALPPRLPEESWPGPLTSTALRTSRTPAAARGDSRPARTRQALRGLLTLAAVVTCLAALWGPVTARPLIERSGRNVGTR